MKIHILSLAALAALASLATVSSGCRSLCCNGDNAPTKAIGVAFNLPQPDGSSWDQPPAFFVRGANSVTRSDVPIVIPKVLDRIDYEGELVVVIGRRASRVSEEEAASCIRGYTCGMDGSPVIYKPDGEKDALRSIAGKSVDGIAPILDHLIPELDPAGHTIILRINGEEVERANTRDLVWGPARLISEISKTITLEPGDVIFTGARQAVPQLRDGDLVEVEIEGIGLLRRKVEAESEAKG